MSVLLLRANRNEHDAEALRARGLDVVVDPYLDIAQVDNPDGAARLLEHLETGADWLVITSVNALHFWSEQLPPDAIKSALVSRTGLRVAAIGEATTEAIRALGAKDVVTPGEGTSRVLATLLADYPAGTVVLPSGSISMRSIPHTLVPQGFTIVEEVVYRTDIVDVPPVTADSLEDHGVEAVVFRSPSAVRAFNRFHQTLPEGIRLVASGPTTADALADAGWTADAIAVDASASALADAVVRALEEPQ